MSPITRLTLFKIPNESHLSAAMDKYATLTRDATKDDAPYILAASATRTQDDPRNKGYTLVAKTVFKTKADMDYYDTECKAHGEIKVLLKDKVVDGPPLTVFMEGEV